MANLHDRFSHYLSPSEYSEFDCPPHFTGIGVSVDPELVSGRALLIARVFNSSPAAHAGLRSGELIVAVDGRKLKGLSIDQATALIKGAPGTDVTLQIERPAAGPRRRQASPLLAERTRRSPARWCPSRLWRRSPKPCTASSWVWWRWRRSAPGAHAEVREAVEHQLHAGARGIVFDLRGNGGGLVEEAQLIASIFIPKGTIVTTRGRTQPTVRRWWPPATRSPPSIPVVVLVDANTASASEIVTAALQDHHRATVVGTHTFGKGVFQEEQPLSNGGALDITVGEYFTAQRA